MAIGSPVAEMHRLEREVLRISEDEKRHLGRELHDGLGQQLTALEFMSQALARSLALEAPQTSQAASELSRHLRQTVAQVRRVSHGLSPPSFDAGGLFSALRELAETTSVSGVPCEFVAGAFAPNISPDAALHLFRIAQESVSNARKHSGASLIQLSLRESPCGLELAVLDNGRGLPPDGPSKQGIGLRLIDYRANQIGAQLLIAVRPGGGLCITCSLPYQKARSE
ncbi:MAG: sensor histidine kinase [Terrimicrobiaceae bacterium]